MERRAFLTLAAAETLAQAAPIRKIKAIAFDGFTTFDPRPIGTLAEELFPTKGLELNSLWRTRQFEYTWLRTLTGTYADFWRVTEDALVYAAKLLKLELTVEKRERLMHAFLSFRAWPDAAPALERLTAARIRMVFLSNFTEVMLNAAVRSSGLPDIFEPHLSTDRVRAYKPDPRAYRMAPIALKLRREEIAFAAFGAWDAAGAKAFGFPTFWVNRMNLPVEELGVAPDGIGTDLNDLANYVMERNTRG